VSEASRLDEPDDREILALLRRVGARPTAPAGDAADVREAVEAEWRAMLAARRRRRAVTGWAVAASVAVAAVGVWLVRPLVQTEPAVVAAVSRAVGGIEVERGDGRWTPVAAADAIVAGMQLRTTGDGRAALRLASGVDLRLDGRTRVSFEDTRHARLVQGAVYVDAGPGPHPASAAFEIETPAGRIEHLGTQYEARVVEGGVRVGVREGQVRLSLDSGDVVGRAGESLTVLEGEVTRTALAPNAPEWRWLETVTPPFEIEGRTVEEFLAWAARETGRTVVFASPDAAGLARRVTLDGTLEGLTPDEAVLAVLSTTSLRPQIGAERIRVEAARP